jgi:DGQHR domain-containing protein
LVQDQRDLEKYLGIQRPVSPKRIKEIKHYLEGEDATFPTSVILAVDEKCAEYEAGTGNTGTLILKEHLVCQAEDDASIPYGKIAKVIDGQHRIAAFMDENGNWSLDFSGSEFDINVAIFIGADVSEQANIFATVNLAQTKVNRSLVYDLTELASVPSPHKTCHNVAVALDRESSSPLYHRIKRLGTATPGRKKEPLTQASFVESLVKFISSNPVQDRNSLLSGGRIKRATEAELVKLPFRNLFVDGKEVDITEILYNYFLAIEKKWPASWKDTDRVGNLLPRSNAFKAFMVYLREDVYPILVKHDYGRIPAVSEFYAAIDHIQLQDDDFTTRNFAPGSGGQATFLKMLRGQISLEDMLDS